MTLRSHCNSTNGEREKLTQVIGANLQRLIPPHYQPDLLRLIMLQQADITCPTLFPLEL